jgi:hypothetical protein
VLPELSRIANGCANQGLRVLVQRFLPVCLPAWIVTDGGSMAQVKLFLSTVSAEFRSYRERLRHGLTRPNVEVKVQEDFIGSGNETLEMLDDYIKGCDGVIHLVGDMTGSPAEAPSLTAIKERYPELATRLPLAEFLQAAGPKLPYTQWEAWLALLHGKRLFIRPVISNPDGVPAVALQPSSLSRPAMS